MGCSRCCRNATRTSGDISSNSSNASPSRTINRAPTTTPKKRAPTPAPAAASAAVVAGCEPRLITCSQPAGGTTPHPAPCTQNHAPYARNPAPKTLNPKCHALQQSQRQHYTLHTTSYPTHHALTRCTLPDSGNITISIISNIETLCILVETCENYFLFNVLLRYLIILHTLQQQNQSQSQQQPQQMLQQQLEQQL